MAITPNMLHCRATFLYRKHLSRTQTQTAERMSLYSHEWRQNNKQTPTRLNYWVMHPVARVSINIYRDLPYATNVGARFIVHFLHYMFFTYYVTETAKECLQNNGNYLEASCLNLVFETTYCCRIVLGSLKLN
jgi:hypothetical protein